MFLFARFTKGIILSAILLITGCVATPPQIQPDAAQALLLQCQSEVKALYSFDLARAQQQQKLLNQLIDSSAKYLLMRTHIGADTQYVVDSVYQAQLAKRCQHIHIELSRAMLKQADEA